LLILLALFIGVPILVALFGWIAAALIP